MKRIIVSVTNDLTYDQRVYKVCKTLIKLDFEILLIGRKFKNSQPIKRPYKTYRMKLLFNKGFLFYAEYNIRLFFKLLFTKKSILLANDLDTLLPNYLISVIQNKKLVYDSHELFSEAPELISRPRVQKFWLGIEAYIYPKLENCYTVCQSIADYYNSKYDTDFKVIRNLPERKIIVPYKFPFDVGEKKIILYQGAINIGRGLELMIGTMKFIEDSIFVIIGDGDIFHELKKLVVDNHLENKVKFLGRIQPSELTNITPLANIGVSLEEDLGLSYHYALPNKIFDYVQAGVPVLVSDLPEMRSVVEKYKIGAIVINRDKIRLAEQIQTILKGDKLNWNKNLDVASKELNWSIEKLLLKNIIKSIEK